MTTRDTCFSNAVCPVLLRLPAMCVAFARGVHHAAVLLHSHMMLRSQGWVQQQKQEQQQYSSSCGSNVRLVWERLADKPAAADKIHGTYSHFLALNSLPKMLPGNI
jgi:hypothetical protein